MVGRERVIYEECWNEPVIITVSGSLISPIMQGTARAYSKRGTLVWQEILLLEEGGMTLTRQRVGSRLVSQGSRTYRLGNDYSFSHAVFIPEGGSPDTVTYPQIVYRKESGPGLLIVETDVDGKELRRFQLQPEKK